LHGCAHLVEVSQIPLGNDEAQIPVSNYVARSRDERKRVEMRFAHLKTHHGFERLRLRGLSGARDEFHLAAIVQNLKTLALRLVWPPPDLATTSVA